MDLCFELCGDDGAECTVCGGEVVGFESGSVVSNKSNFGAMVGYMKEVVCDACITSIQERLEQRRQQRLAEENEILALKDKRQTNGAIEYSVVPSSDGLLFDMSQSLKQILGLPDMGKRGIVSGMLILHDGETCHAARVNMPMSDAAAVAKAASDEFLKRSKTNG